MAISADSCVVALLGRDDGARRQLRQALEELGAAVAFESEPAGASDAGVLGVSPNVVIVNLEEGVDDDLDHLQAVLDDPAINVVFNDADVSRTLEGWDLARWARHLAAKVLGSEDTMPPPPAGAELLGDPDAFIPEPGPVPTPEQLAPAPSMDAFLDEALDVADDVPVDELPELAEAIVEDEEFTETLDAEAAHDGDAATDLLDIDLTSLDDALEADDLPAPVKLASTPELVESGSVDALVQEDLSDDIARALDGVMDDAPAGETSTATTAANDSVEFGWEFDEAAETALPDAEPVAALSGDEEDLARFEEAVVFDAPSDDAVTEEAIAEENDFSWDITRAEAEVGAGEAGEEVELAFETASWSVDASNDAQEDDSALLDADVAAMAAQLEALEAAEPASGVEAGLDFSTWDDAAAIEVASPQEDASEPVVATPEPAAAPVTFGGLSLAPLDDEPVVSEPASVTAKPSYDFSSLGDLSLEPLEGDDAPPEVVEAVSEEASEPDIDPLLVAMGLVETSAVEAVIQPDRSHASISEDAAGAGIKRVIVLGASIGGPDALRSFLAELPTGMPTVFLLVQHLESGYFERLAQQLQKSSPMPVKVAAANTVAVPGEVLVIPASERVTLEGDGRLVFAPHASVPQYTPSIDTVLRDVADRFGSKATAIIFSGMAGDAVEGAVYLTAKGGEVWAQDASSCVVSSMVDGAQARGVVEFTGSPRELAQRCITQFMR